MVYKIILYFCGTLEKIRDYLRRVQQKKRSCYAHKNIFQDDWSSDRSLSSDNRCLYCLTYFWSQIGHCGFIMLWHMTWEMVAWLLVTLTCHVCTFVSSSCGCKPSVQSIHSKIKAGISYLHWNSPKIFQNKVPLYIHGLLAGMKL